MAVARSAPGIRAVRSALGGLRMTSSITSAAFPSVTFSPTVGIAAARVDKLGMDIRSFKEPLTRAIREVVAPSIRRNFDVGGRPKWAPLAEATLSWRQRQGVMGTAPLIRSGALRRVASQINIWSIDRTSAVLAHLPQQVWYGNVHQAGLGDRGAGMGGFSAHLAAGGDSRGSIRSGGRVADIPARPFVLLQKGDERKIHEIFEKWLQERINKTWGLI